MRFVALRCFALVVAVLTAAPEHGRAQDQEGESSTSEVALADQLHAEGVRAYRAGDMAGALAAFRRAFEVGDQPRDLLNWASLSAEASRFVESVELYRRYLRRADAPRRDEVAAALSEVERRLAYLRLQIRNLAGADVLTLDGVAVSHASVGERIPIDPGGHVIEVARSARSLARRELDAAEGETLELSIALPRPPPSAPRRDRDAPTPEEEGRALVASPWLWTIVGVIVLGGLAVGGYFLFRDVQGPPGDIPPIIIDG